LENEDENQKPSGVTNPATMRLNHTAFVFFAMFTLVGCPLDLPPVVSATVETHGFSQRAQTTNLSFEKVRALASWFAEHSPGWSRSVVSYVPTLWRFD